MWCYSVPLPWCTKVAYGVRYAVSILVTKNLPSDVCYTNARLMVLMAQIHTHNVVRGAFGVVWRLQVYL